MTQTSLSMVGVVRTCKSSWTSPRIIRMRRRLCWNKTTVQRKLSWMRRMQLLNTITSELRRIFGRTTEWVKRLPITVVNLTRMKPCMSLPKSVMVLKMMSVITVILPSFTVRMRNHVELKKLWWRRTSLIRWSADRSFMSVRKSVMCWPT